MKYLPLAIEITQNGGHHYHQVWRDEHAAVYEQRGHYNQLLGYEAILIKRQEAQKVFGKWYEAKELYPVAEDWGKIAVTRRTLESAKEAAELFSKRASARAGGHMDGPPAHVSGSGQRIEAASARLRAKNVDDNIVGAGR